MLTSKQIMQADKMLSQYDKGISPASVRHKEDVNRFDVLCPECGNQSNSEEHADNENCFHCGICGWTECHQDDPVSFLKPGETKITDSLKKMI